MPKTRSLRSLLIGPARPAPSGPPSPTFSETTNVSAMNFGENGPDKIITRANLKASIQGYESLITTCANYRAALMTLSRATAAFADAMQTCSSLKGPTYETGTRLQAASGLHHLMGNHWHVLSETFNKEFEKPLRQHLQEYRATIAERSAAYEKQLHEKSRLIRLTESRNMNKKGRNMQSFREALTILQRQVDELDELKAQHYSEIIEHEEEVWDVVQGKVSIVVRSTMDVFDRFTAKSSDPVLEPMLQSVPDPFDSYGLQQGEDQIFTILPPLSIIPAPASAHAPSPSPSPLSSAASSYDQHNHNHNGMQSPFPSPFTASGPNSASASTSSLVSPWSRASSSVGGFFATPAREPTTAWADVAAHSPATSPSSSVSVSPPPRATSPSPGARPTSPFGAAARRNSHPPAASSSLALSATVPVHRPRKSETKLRSTLSIIDESAARASASASGAHSAAASTSSGASAHENGAANGNGNAEAGPASPFPDDADGGDTIGKTAGSLLLAQGRPGAGAGAVVPEEADAWGSSYVYGQAPYANGRLFNGAPAGDSPTPSLTPRAGSAFFTAQEVDRESTKSPQSDKTEVAVPS